MDFRSDLGPRRRDLVPENKDDPFWDRQGGKGEREAEPEILRVESNNPYRDKRESLGVKYGERF